MKRLLSYLFFISVSFTALCQGPPVWYDSAMRDMKYPREMFFTGFAIGKKNPGESAEDAIRRISDEAKVEAVSGIRMTVSKVMNSTSSSSLTTGSQGVSEVSKEDFVSSTIMRTDIRDVPGLLSEFWTDPDKGIVAAFAYVSKSELARKVDRRLTVNITKLEMAVEGIGELAAASRLKDASDALEGLKPILDDIDEDQKLLVSVDASLSDEDLQIPRFNELKNVISSIEDSLKDGVSIYLSCSAEIFGDAYSDFEEELKAALSGFRCHFVESSEDAERTIVINASAVEHSKSELYNLSNYFCYVNLDMTLENKVKGVCVYDGRISQKGGHTKSYRDAAVDGYKDIVGKVMLIIENNLL